jgi:hypothetical protein
MAWPIAVGADKKKKGIRAKKEGNVRKFIFIEMNGGLFIKMKGGVSGNPN